VRRPCYLGSLLLVGALLLSACPQKNDTKRPRAAASRADVESYTESAPVNAVTQLGKTLWVGTGQGLVAWNLKEAKARILTIDDGLPGNNVLTLATDGKQTLWVGTATGVARLRVGRWTQFGDCPLGDDINAMAAAKDGETVWVGGPKGLARLQREKWKRIYQKGEVTALQYLAKEDVLWVATRKDGALRCKGIKCAQYGAKRIGANNVTRLARGKHGVLAIVAGEHGDAVAYRYKGRWHRYKLEPSRVLDWAHFARGTLFLSAGSTVYKLIPRTEVETPDGPIELKPQTSGAPEFIASKVERQLPRYVTVVSQALGSLWIGSQRLGVARFNGDLLQYFRTNDLTQGARRLSLTCTDAISCYMATGSRLYKKSGKAWTRIHYTADADASFQWVGKDAKGQVIALLRSGRGSLEVVRQAGKGWTALELTPALHTKQGPLLVNFARLGPKGKLWIGLAIQESDDTRGAGLAVVDLATNKVSLHGRGTGLPETAGGLGVPSDLSGAAFLGDLVYLGSRGGVVRIAADSSIRVFTENDGLASELIQEIAESDGKIYVATPSGLGVYDGKVWKFGSGTGPRAARVNTVLRSPDGAFWFGGTGGLHRIRGSKLTSFDDADGLLDNKVRSIVIDQHKRIWALHGNGISIVKPR